jgi:hypothetical protein
VGRKDSVAHPPIVRVAQAKRAGPRMPTGRHGRVPEIVLRLPAGICDPTHPLTTATGRPRHRQMVAAATRMAVTRTETAPISRPHDRVCRPEIITRTPPRTTLAAAAAALMRHRRALIRHRAAVILHLRDRIPRLPTRLQAVPIQHQAEATPLLAVAMEEEEEGEGVTAAVAADRMEVVAEALRTAAEVAARTDRTDIKNFSAKARPSIRAGFSFAPRNILWMFRVATLKRCGCLVRARQIGPFPIGHRENA